MGIQGGGGVVPAGVCWFPCRGAGCGWGRGACRAARPRGSPPSVTCFGGLGPGWGQRRFQPPPPSFGGRRRLGPERSLLASGRERGTLGAGPRPPLRCARHFPSLSGVPADRFGCFRDSSALGRQFPCWGRSPLSGVTRCISEPVRPSAPGPSSGAAGR